MAGKTTPAELYAAVGECLNTWTRVETEVSTLFMVVHSQPWDDFTHPLRAAFEAVIAFEARLDMIYASVGADSGLVEYRPHFNALYNKLSKAHKKRHEVAHFALFGAAGKDGPVIGLKPFFTFASLRDKTGRPELLLPQIKERNASFVRLVSSVEQHVQHVGTTKALPAGYFLRAGDRAHPPLEKVDQTPEEP